MTIKVGIIVPATLVLEVTLRPQAMHVDEEASRDNHSCSRSCSPRSDRGRSPPCERSHSCDHSYNSRSHHDESVHDVEVYATEAKKISFNWSPSTVERGKTVTPLVHHSFCNFAVALKS